LRVRRDVPSLRKARVVREIERSLREIRERGRARVVHYSVQTNHLHLIVEATSRVDLSCGMKAIAARVARAVNRAFGRRGPVLGDRFHARVLRTPREVRHAIAYVLLNARRHAAKLGRRVDAIGRIDPASSGRWFDGWRQRDRADRVDRAGAADQPAVALPRSWLLSVGWRRSGLIDPAEVPGGSGDIEAAMKHHDLG
jgi:REP element-mobilizing transposase RayT